MLIQLLLKQLLLVSVEDLVLVEELLNRIILKKERKSFGLKKENVKKTTIFFLGTIKNFCKNSHTIQLNGTT